jgi:hypothetical protein
MLAGVFARFYVALPKNDDPSLEAVCLFSVLGMMLSLAFR